MQLLIRNAAVRGSTESKDIVIDDGKIIEIIEAGSKYSTDSGFDSVIDANGSLVTESFVSPHIHLDKILIGKTIVNETGELWEAIAKTWEYKRNYSFEDIMTRASEIINKQIEYGATKFRTHVDIDSIGGLKPLEGLLKVRERYKTSIELQIVAFPQEGIIKDEGTKELMIKAVEMGADCVGGMPHNENTLQDSIKHIEVIFDIAEQFKVPIDAHVDETDDPNSKTLELMAAEAIRRNFTFGVTVDHICALSSYNDYHAARVIGLVKKAQINVVTNPPTNMVLQGRLDTGTQRVGITRVKELLQAGINVTVGQDCIKDPYYPFGRGDMLDVALLTGHAAKMTLPQEINQLYDFITTNALITLGFELSNYDMSIGSFADLVILRGVTDVWEAIRTLPQSRTTIKNGKILSESKYSVSRYY